MAADARELCSDASGLKLGLAEAVALPATLLARFESGEASLLLDVAVEFADLAGLSIGGPGATVGAVPHKEMIVGVVVNVMPLYIIVTEGHALSAENGLLDPGKQ
jgi:hypothetical protein